MLCTHNYLNGAYVIGIYHIIIIARYVSIYAKQKHLGCQKGEANQKQQLSGYIAIHVTKNFDIKLRPSIR